MTTGADAEALLMLPKGMLPVAKMMLPRAVLPQTRHHSAWHESWIPAFAALWKIPDRRC